MFDETTERYTRQMTLPQLGEDGQLALREARVLIMGLGGLGSPAAMYLAAAGIGGLTLCDDDRVALSNLHRQILYTDRDLGQTKTAAAEARLREVQPELQTRRIGHRMAGAELGEAVEAADLVLDCSDNFATRHAVNRACVRTRTPLVSGAAIRLEGQIGVFNRRPASPCYACLYPEGEEETAERCSEVGVLGPLVGIIGSMQAMEAIKILADIGECLDGRVQILDAQRMEWRSVKLGKDPQCPVCSTQTL